MSEQPGRRVPEVLGQPDLVEPDQLGQGEPARRVQPEARAQPELRGQLGRVELGQPDLVGQAPRDRPEVPELTVPQGRPVQRVTQAPSPVQPVRRDRQVPTAR